MKEVEDLWLFTLPNYDYDPRDFIDNHYKNNELY